MIQVNVYRSAGVWCYAAWCDGEYDCSDVLGVEDAADDAAALAEAARQWPHADVRRVPDIS